MADVLTEYLVSLGFTTDEPSFNKLKNVMSDSERLVTQYAGGMAKSIIGAQTAIVGGFLSVSAAIVGVVDKVAMADQAWRLMGLRMMTTTETARKMDMIQKALGVSLEEIVWDPSGELQKRARDMGDEIDRLTKMLGGDFKQNMRGVRDLRAEFSMLGIDLEFLGMKFSSDLFKGLTGQADPLAWLKEKIDWFEGHIPEFSAALTSYAVPALKETWQIAQDLGKVLGAAGLAFTNIVGLLSGDASIQGSSLDFEKMATAIGHVAHGFESLLGWITQAELLLAHFASGMALALTGKFDAALAEFKKGIAELTTGSGAALGLLFGPEGAVIGGALGGAAEAARKGLLGDEAKRQAGKPTTGTESTAGPFGAVSDGAKKMLGLDGGSAGAPRPSGSWTKEWEKKDNSALGTLKFLTAEVADEVQTYWDFFHLKPTTETKSIDPKQLKKDREEALKKWAGVTAPAPVAVEHKATSKHAGVEEMIRTSADQYGVPQAMALAVAKHESGFNPAAKNFNRDKAGNITSTDWGVMQLNDQTLKTFKMSSDDALNAGKNIDVGVRLLSQLMKHYEGDQVKALAAYSAGQGRVDKAAGLASLPEVTRKAVPEILQIEKQFMTTEEKATAPSWYALTPEFMRTSPVWYGVAPAWMTKHPEGDSGKIGTAWADTKIATEFKAKMDSAQRPIVADTGSANVTHSTTVTFGDIVITQPGATQHQIQRAVDEGVRDALNSQVRNDLTQTSPLY